MGGWPPILVEILNEYVRRLNFEFDLREQLFEDTLLETRVDSKMSEEWR